jgi:hypothetical protein
MKTIYLLLLTNLVFAQCKITEKESKIEQSKTFYTTGSLNTIQVKIIEADTTFEWSFLRMAIVTKKSYSELMDVSFLNKEDERVFLKCKLSNEGFINFSCPISKEQIRQIMKPILFVKIEDVEMDISKQNAPKKWVLDLQDKLSCMKVRLGF